MIIYSSSIAAAVYWTSEGASKDEKNIFNVPQMLVIC